MRSKDGRGATRIIVAATSAVRRGGLEAIVREDPSLRLAGSVANLANLASQGGTLRADVLLADLADANNEQFLSDVQELADDAISTVALIDEPEPGWVSKALRAGVRAILPRDSSSDDIVSAVHAAHRGLFLLDPGVARDLTNNVRAPNSVRPETLEELTPREIEVLRMMAEGFANKEIALRLSISDHTVKFHISSILGKLGVSSRTEAVTQGIRMGLILL